MIWCKIHCRKQVCFPVTCRDRSWSMELETRIRDLSQTFHDFFSVPPTFHTIIVIILNPKALGYDWSRLWVMSKKYGRRIFWEDHQELKWSDGSEEKRPMPITHHLSSPVLSSRWPASLPPVRSNAPFPFRLHFPTCPVLSFAPVPPREESSGRILSKVCAHCYAST